MRDLKGSWELPTTLLAQQQCCDSVLPISFIAALSGAGLGADGCRGPVTLGLSLRTFSAAALSRSFRRLAFLIERAPR